MTDTEIKNLAFIISDRIPVDELRGVREEVFEVIIRNILQDHFVVRTDMVEHEYDIAIQAHNNPNRDTHWFGCGARLALEHLFYPENKWRIIEPKDLMNDKVQTIRELAAKIADTYELKNHDYGDSFGISVRKYGIISALTRISDKFNRAEQLILSKEQKVNDEALEDTLLDLATYCMMTVAELKGGAE